MDSAAGSNTAGSGPEPGYSPWRDSFQWTAVVLAALLASLATVPVLLQHYRW